MNPQLTMTLANQHNRDLTAGAATRPVWQGAVKRAAKPRHRFTRTPITLAPVR